MGIKYLRKIALAIGFTLTILFVNGQATGESDLGAWYMFDGDFRLSEKVSFPLAIQLRTYELTTNHNHALVLAGLNYRLGSDQKVGLGYGYLHSDYTYEGLGDEQLTFEHRVFEQYCLRQGFKKLLLDHRIRLEQRFFDGELNDSYQDRLRYRLRIKQPLGKRWHATAYDEIFADLGEMKYAQNWAYVGIGYQFDKVMGIEVGYLNQDTPTKNFDRLQFTFRYRADLRKPKPKVGYAMSSVSESAYEHRANAGARSAE